MSTIPPEVWIEIARIGGPVGVVVIVMGVLMYSVLRVFFRMVGSRVEAIDNHMDAISTATESRSSMLRDAFEAQGRTIAVIAERLSYLIGKNGNGKGSGTSGPVS